MFCSSLRRRRDWAAIVPVLARSSGPGWKEKQLSAHDIALPAPSPGGADSIFRVILLSTAEVGSQQARDRVERLSLLDGGRNVAIVLLLHGPDCMAAFANLQIETLDYSIPIIPVSSAAELPACLDSLRRQLQSAPRGSNNQDLDGAARDLVSHCVRGQALSEHQTNVLTGISGGFRDLAEVAFLPANQGLVIDYLGEKDGKRLVSFLADGPALANM